MNKKHKKCDENKHDQSNMYFLFNQSWVGGWVGGWDQNGLIAAARGALYKLTSDLTQ